MSQTMVAYGTLIISRYRSSLICSVIENTPPNMQSMSVFLLIILGPTIRTYVCREPAVSYGTGPWIHLMGMTLPDSLSCIDPIL